MKTRKLQAIVLSLVLVLILLPLHVTAEENSVWLPIKSGETVSGNASYGFNERYSIKADYAGELVLEMDFNNDIYVLVQNAEGWCHNKVEASNFLPKKTVLIKVPITAI